MKSLTILLGALLLLCAGCKDAFKNVLPKKTTTAITVVGDQTDLLRKQPDDKEVVGLFNINDDRIHEGYSLRYRDIADVSNNDVQSLRVEPEYAMFSNDNSRIAALKNFKERIRNIFAEGKKRYQTTENQSVVYSTVISEANKLALLDNGGGEKYLLVYSNLLDHDPTLDLYNPIILNAVVSHPEQVMKSLEGVMKVENLKGVKILILFQANDHDIAEDRRFSISSNFYKRLFSEHGAEVVVTSSLTSMN